MTRFLLTTALISGLAASAQAQNSTIPTFDTGQSQSGQIPTFGTTEPSANQIPTFGTAAAPTPAMGGNVLASDPARVLALVQEAGLVATLTVDGVGDPKIESEVSETPFGIYFYGCTDNTACTNLQFAAGYDLANGITLQAINDWNASKRYAFAYADEEFDPFLNMDVSLDFDGIGPENLKDLIALWRLQVEDFEDHIGW